MVLERGELMEYASPLELLNDPNSLFYALCKKTGALEQLKETARVEQEDRLARDGGGGGGGGSEGPKGGDGPALSEQGLTRGASSGGKG